jgi:hypothetical protein
MMALLFLPFISMLIPRAHELAVASEEEEEQVDKGKKMNQGKNELHPNPPSRRHSYPCSKQEHMNAARVRLPKIKSGKGVVMNE